MPKYLLFFLLLAAAMAPMEASADLVAEYAYYLNKTDTLIVDLSNTSSIDSSELSECEVRGEHRVLLQTTNKFMYPRVIPYADGCWFYANGIVHVSFTAIEDRSVKANVSYRVKNFKTTDSFTKWDDFRRWVVPGTVEKSASEHK